MSFSEREPVRVHVEDAVDGLHVWVGADDGGAAMPARAAAIVAELRRSEQLHSTTVASIVVNGRLLYASGTRAASLVETPR
jgi:hypothetical protein